MRRLETLNTCCNLQNETIRAKVDMTLWDTTSSIHCLIVAFPHLHLFDTTYVIIREHMKGVCMIGVCKNGVWRVYVWTSSIYERFFTCFVSFMPPLNVSTKSWKYVVNGRQRLGRETTTLSTSSSSVNHISYSSRDLKIFLLPDYLSQRPWRFLEGGAGDQQVVDIK